MIYFATATQEQAEKLAKQAYRVSSPLILAENRKTRKYYQPKVHPYSPNTYSVLSMVDESWDVPVSPISKIIVRTQGGTLSSSDESWLRDNFNQFGPTNNYPSVEALIQAIKDYWSYFTNLYPDQQKRNTVIDKVENNSRIFIKDLIPEWVSSLSENDVFIQKWFSVNFNNLSQSQLESSRFSTIDSTLAETIINERNNNGNFEDLENLETRVSIPENTSTEFSSSVLGGSLYFD
jgi:hypothetical protein